MAEKLTDFVLTLSQDPRALREFRSNPEKVMTKAGLSIGEQALVQARDPKALREAVFADLGPNPGQAATEWGVVIVNIHTKGSLIR